MYKWTATHSKPPKQTPIDEYKNNSCFYNERMKSILFNISIFTFNANSFLKESLFANNMQVRYLNDTVNTAKMNKEMKSERIGLISRVDLAIGLITATALQMKSKNDPLTNNYKRILYMILTYNSALTRPIKKCKLKNANPIQFLSSCAVVDICDEAFDLNDLVEEGRL